jgi:hypothetical protein
MKLIFELVELLVAVSLVLVLIGYRLARSS